MESTKETTPCIPPEKNSLLISEVEKFTSLYDTSDPNYYLLAERNKAWLQVAKNCDEPADQCHLRWKSLRKRYAKEKRKFPDILQGHRKPWALFPKMSFLTPSGFKRRIKPEKIKGKTEASNISLSSDFKQSASDDDMLILDDNNKIVLTCKSVEMSEEDEYIYETLDDPDSALEIMKGNPFPEVKPTAIRSGSCVKMQTGITSSSFSIPARTSGSGRIRKLTPKMQNSIIAKKLKQAQQTIHQSSVSVPNKSSAKKSKSLQRVMMSNHDQTQSKYAADKTVLYQDKTTRHVATVNPNIIRVERIAENGEQSFQNTCESSDLVSKNEHNLVSPDKNRPFKVVKLKGRNPIIFSPDKLTDLQQLLKSEALANQEQTDMKPLIKVKSVDHLNNQNSLCSNVGENKSLDIIHSLGLVRKSSVEQSIGTDKMSHQTYSRAYSWNRPSVKMANKQTTTENIQPDSQTKDYEIEETWNDIKQETVDDEPSWSQPTETESHMHEEITGHSSDSMNKANIWNRVNEAKLELISYQRKLLEEQHKKNLEYMKKEHELKMTLLKAEIDLKRKQLNIML